MARIYEHQPSYFGPQSWNSDVCSDELKIQKDLIEKGYQRVHEKTKNWDKTSEIPVSAGRSGSAKISDR